MKSPGPSRKNPTSASAKPLLILGSLLVISVLAFSLWKTSDRSHPQVVVPVEDPRPAAPAPDEAAQAARDAELISAIVADEETYLKLAPKMKVLSDGLLNLKLPGLGTEPLFAPSMNVSDLGPAPTSPPGGTGLSEPRAWPVDEALQETTRADLWRPMLDLVSYFDHAKLFITRGEHPGSDPFRYDSEAGFEASARMKSGEWWSLNGRIQLTWVRTNTAEGNLGDWRISRWKTEEMQWIAGPKRLFDEVLDTAMRSRSEAAKLRRSQHYAATVKYYREGMKPPHPYFAPISVNQKEGLAIVDVNGDGFDDIYITVRLGKNMLLVNQGDGTFVEEAARYKLDLPGHTTCALFADFDNDGDQDVILGRSLLKTSYLENRQGVYYQHPIPSFMPMAVISMAAADYNLDGLLDVYLCTYRPAAPIAASPAGGVAQGREGDFDWPDEFFSPETAREFRRRLAENQQRKGGTVLDQVGPPNFLLINRGGGRFEPAPENGTVGIWRNSLQATWGDYDQDGDPDLFVANDWAPSNLFRNDREQGFKDVTEEAGTTAYGFSMGASWGDYDNDGLEDLYVSNMYSEAGRRITARIPELSRMFVESATGNWLYKQKAKGKFEQAAGLEAPAMTVMNAGWSWGGCFIDFDNDAFLDLYVLSGYFTAPKGLASGLDLESNLWRTMVRTDENLARASFRFSPEWKRTRHPDNPGPKLDARLAGVERQGDHVWVHPLNGSERNHYFANRKGQSFLDISGISGLDNVADSRGFAVLDYDRDGWQDLALVNANEPLFNLYRNEMAAAGFSGGIIAVRFVGGNRTAEPSQEFGCRDGYGARVAVDLGDRKLIREHRCGDGWSTQNSPTMIIGIGDRRAAASVTVRWPSGRTTVAKEVAEGTLLVVYENPADSPNPGEAFVRSAYRANISAPAIAEVDRPVFPLAAADTRAKPGARLRVYTTFATGSAACRSWLPLQQLLKDELADEGVDIVAIPIDEADDNSKLAAFAQEWRPAARLVNLAPNIRNAAAGEFAKLLGGEAPMPSSVITDGSGRILGVQAGVPTISALRKMEEEL